MIKNYSFKNFQSFSDECTVDFMVNNKTPHSYYDQELNNNQKVAKVMTVMGANGAGKSNLLKPLSFLSWFIPHSFGTLEKDEKLAIFSHLLSSEKETDFNINFFIQFSDREEGLPSNYEYKYALKLSEGRVVFEELKLKTSHLFSKVFTRSYSSESGTCKVKIGSNIQLNIPGFILENVPKNCSLISYIAAISEGETKKSSLTPTDLTAIIPAFFFSSCRSNLIFSGKSPLFQDIETATTFYKDFPEQFDFVKNLIMKYDLGISDIVLEDRVIVDKKSGQQEQDTIPVCVHQFGDSSFELPLFRQSTGTISAYCVLAAISHSLVTGGVAILDEFDNELHPHLTMEIVNLFKDESTNQHGAQLIFNTHNPEVLKHLRRQHCYFVEKYDGKSEAYRADEIEGLKDRDNLYSKYISGALGAVPEFE